MCSFSTEFNESVSRPEGGVEAWWEPEKRQSSGESSAWNHSVADCHRGAIPPEDHRHSVGLLTLCWQWWTQGAIYLLLSDRLAVSLKSTLSFALSDWKKKKKSTLLASSVIVARTDKVVTDGWMCGWVGRDYSEEWAGRWVSRVADVYLCGQ